MTCVGGNVQEAVETILCLRRSLFEKELGGVCGRILSGDTTSTTTLKTDDDPLQTMNRCMTQDEDSGVAGQEEHTCRRKRRTTGSRQNEVTTVFVTGLGHGRGRGQDGDLHRSIEWMLTRPKNWTKIIDFSTPAIESVQSP